METLILLFLLVALEKDPALKDAFRNFLGFYKENRELISAVLQQNDASGAVAHTAAAAPEAAEVSSATQKESRPRTKVGSLSILEEYLKRCEI